MANCVKCGAPLQKGDKFCTNCGAPIKAQTGAAPRGRKKKTRSFVYDDGTKSKFWEITVTGLSFTVHYGKTGTNGQSREKSFESADDCKEGAEKVIAEKLKEGYEEQD